MELGEYAERMFARPVSDVRLPLVLEDAEDVKDLFCMCVDLFCRGLSIMFGASVDVSSLTLQDFEDLSGRMQKGGIRPALQVQQRPAPVHMAGNVTNAGEVDSFPDGLPLEAYVFTVGTSDALYHVRFHLQRM